MPGGWLVGVEIVLALLIIMIVPIAFLALRRRWLSRAGGVFDCSVRVDLTAPGAGWALGLARYTEAELQWFRFFAVRFQPQVVIPRSRTTIWEVRDPQPVEAVALYTGHRIVKAEADGVVREIAMSQASVTGLFSWLESLPPGQGLPASSPSTAT